MKGGPGGRERKVSPPPVQVSPQSSAPSQSWELLVGSWAELAPMPRDHGVPSRIMVTLLFPTLSLDLCGFWEGAPHPLCMALLLPGHTSSRLPSPQAFSQDRITHGKNPRGKQQIAGSWQRVSTACHHGKGGAEDTPCSSLRP